MIDALAVLRILDLAFHVTPSLICSVLRHQLDEMPLLVRIDSQEINVIYCPAYSDESGLQHQIDLKRSRRREKDEDRSENA